MNILVTGGCGFIGSHFIRYMAYSHPDDLIVNLDALTYAGKKENLKNFCPENYKFAHGNICDKRLVRWLFKLYKFGAVVNFAAETHVDNSIKNPAVFVESNVMGVQNLLDCAREIWGESRLWKEQCRFLQVSTDEVYGSLPLFSNLRLTEQSPIEPSSPYSASKASAELIALSYFKTFGIPVLITRCSNNYGPNQDKEKLIPLMINRALRDQKLPVYGDGQNVRDWLYVGDHCEAIDCVLRKAEPGSIYNVGGNKEIRNIDLVRQMLKLLGKSDTLINFVTDRPGHDKRYAINAEKIEREFGWRPRTCFEDGLKKTVKWYVKKFEKNKK